MEISKLLWLTSIMTESSQTFQLQLRRSCAVLCLISASVFMQAGGVGVWAANLCGEAHFRHALTDFCRGSTFSLLFSFFVSFRPHPCVSLFTHTRKVPLQKTSKATPSWVCQKVWKCFFTYRPPFFAFKSSLPVSCIRNPPFLQKEAFFVYIKTHIKANRFATDCPFL